MSEDEFRRRYIAMRGLLAQGVPWPIAREALASTALDRDQTHEVVPSWWREDDDGVRIVDRD